MKSKLIIFGLGFISAVLLGIIFALFIIGKHPASSSTTLKLQKLYDPDIDGWVPNEETAIKIAEAIWLTVFPEEDVIYYKPYRAELKDDEIWIVRGSVPYPRLVSLPYIEIQKSDGKILMVKH